MYASVINKMNPQRATVTAGETEHPCVRTQVIPGLGLRSTGMLACQKLNFEKMCIFLAYFLADFCYVSASSSGKVQCQVSM